MVTTLYEQVSQKCRWVLLCNEKLSDKLNHMVQISFSIPGLYSPSLSLEKPGCKPSLFCRLFMDRYAVKVHKHRKNRTISCQGCKPSLFCRLFMDRYAVKVHKHRKNRTISCHLDRMYLFNKGFIIWRKENNG